MERSACLTVFVLASIAFSSSCSKDGVSPPAATFDAGAVDSTYVDASGEVTLDASNDVDVDASGEVALDASNDVDVDASSEVALDAPNIDVDAPSEVALDATNDVGAFEADTAALDVPAGEAGPRDVGGRCNANSDCVATYLCIDGVCNAPDGLCGEGTNCITNCRSPGFFPYPNTQCLGGWVRACVNGICAAKCSVPAMSGVPPGCPVGYGCDAVRDVCILNPTPCVGSGPSTCEAGKVCVEERCVSACPDPDAGTQGSCPADTLCINGGCLSIEKAGFRCKDDGDSCGGEWRCFHHQCIRRCEEDPRLCTSQGGTCKQMPPDFSRDDTDPGLWCVADVMVVTTECDLRVGKGCPTGLCIDGICK